jgi:hypothetical protein
MSKQVKSQKSKGIKTMLARLLAIGSMQIKCGTA